MRGMLLSTLLWAVVAATGCDGCASDPDAPDALLRAEQHFDEAKLRDALGRIDRWLEAQAPVGHAQLRPGSSSTALDERLDGVVLPRELRILYEWHDGADSAVELSVPFLYGHGFPTLEDALDESPRFSFSSFEGEHFYVILDGQPHDALPIHHHFIEVPERPIVHTNLTTMMQTWADAMDAGLLAMKHAPGMYCERDDKGLAALHQRLNPGAKYPYAVP